MVARWQNRNPRILDVIQDRRRLWVESTEKTPIFSKISSASCQWIAAVNSQVHRATTLPLGDKLLIELVRKVFSATLRVRLSLQRNQIQKKRQCPSKNLSLTTNDKVGWSAHSPKSSATRRFWNIGIKKDARQTWRNSVTSVDNK